MILWWLKILFNLVMYFGAALICLLENPCVDVSKGHLVELPKEIWLGYPKPLLDDLLCICEMMLCSIMLMKNLNPSTVKHSAMNNKHIVNNSRSIDVGLNIFDLGCISSKILTRPNYLQRLFTVEKLLQSSFQFPIIQTWSIEP